MPDPRHDPDQTLDPSAQSPAETPPVGDGRTIDSPPGGGTVDLPTQRDTMEGGDDNQNFRVEATGTVDHIAGAEGETPIIVSGPSRRKAQRLAQVKVPGYEILAELGRGGMGVVYKARDTKLDRTVALKMVLAGAHASEMQLTRFVEEARAVAKFEHQNIVHIYEINEVEGLPYFSLEFVDGGALDKKLDHKPQSPQFAATMVETLSRAMQYAHDRGVIHRDLKPGNVLLTKDGAPKIADFGLAKQQQSESSQTQAGQVMGTPNYMAPEQARGDVTAIGPASDQFALGGILYEMMTGRPPFNGATLLQTLDAVRNQDPPPPSQLNPHMPRDLETIALKCLQKDIAKRYASCTELAEDLRRFREGRPILARPVSNWERAVRWTKRNPVVAGLLGGVALLLITVTAVSSISWLTIRGKNKELFEKAETERGLRIESDQRLEKTRELTQAIVTDLPDKMRGSLYYRKFVDDVLGLVDQFRRQAEAASDDRHIQARADQAALMGKGDALLQEKKFPEAIAEYEKARDVAEQVLNDNPRDKDKSEGNLAVALARLGEAWFKRGDDVRGREYYEKALARRRQVVDAPQSGELPEAERRASLVDSLLRVNELLLQRRDYGAALVKANEAVEAMEKLDPKKLQAKHHVTLGQAYMTRGRTFFQSEDHAAGRREFDRGLAELRAAVKREPLNLAYQQQLAKSCSEAGRYELLFSGDAARAQVRYDEAVKVFSGVIQPPELLGLQREQSLHLYEDAAAALKAGDKATAEKSFRACLDLRLAVLKANPKNDSLRNEVMLAQARCGLAHDAAQTAADFEKTGDTQRDVRYKIKYLDMAAMGFALCGDAVVMPINGPPPLEAHIQRKEYLDRALALLERMYSLGYRDIDELKRDPDFDPLRGEDGFKKLVEKVEKSLKK